MEEKQSIRKKVAEGLFGAVVITYLLPRFLKALLFMATKEELSGFLSGAFEFVALVLAGFVAAYALGGVKQAVKVVCISGSCILAIPYLSRALLSLPFWKGWSMVSNILFYIVWLIQLLWTGLFTAVFVIHGLDREHKTTFGKRIKMAFGCILPVLVFSIAYTLTQFLSTAFLDSFVSKETTYISVGAYFAKLLFLALLVFAVLYLPLLWMANMARNKLDSMEQTEGAVAPATAKKGGDWALGGIAFGCIVVSLIVSSLSVPSPKLIILNELSTYARDAALYYDAGNYMGVMRSLEYMDGVKSAWEYALSEEDTDELKQLRDRFPTHEQIRYLTIADLQNDKSQAARAEILRNPYEPSWAFLYLQSLKEEAEAGKELSEEEKSFRDEMILSLISSDLYTDSSLNPNRIRTKEKEAIQEALYEDLLAPVFDDFQVASLKLLKSEEGETTIEQVDRWIALAEAHPDSLTVNGLTLTSTYDYLISEETNRKKSEGEKILSDQQKEALIRCVNRYDEMYGEILEVTDQTEEERNEVRAEEKYMLTTLLVEMEADETQAFILDALKECESEDLKDILMNLALRNFDYDTASPILDKRLEKDPDNIYDRYLSVLVAFRTEDMDKAVDELCTFAELVTSREGEPDEGAMLMALVDTFINGDVSLMRGQVGETQGNSPYTNLTDGQRNKIRQVSYLDRLMECDYAYRFWQHGVESREELEAYEDLEKTMQELVTEAPWLSCSYYFLGNLYSYSSIGGSYVSQGNIIDLDQAITLYKESLEIDPEQGVVWYCLAATLDEVGEYKEAYDCAKKSYEISSREYNAAWGEEFHGYGTIVHVERLMRTLEQYLQTQSQ